jgi:hypothetical protein
MIEWDFEKRIRENAARAVAECRAEEAALAELQAADAANNQARLASLESARLKNRDCFQDGA